jgi:hypothetical protein
MGEKKNVLILRCITLLILFNLIKVLREVVRLREFKMKLKHVGCYSETF